MFGDGFARTMLTLRTKARINDQDHVSGVHILCAKKSGVHIEIDPI